MSMLHHNYTNMNNQNNKFMPSISIPILMSPRKSDFDDIGENYMKTALINTVKEL